jgi:hypothetical protein
VVGKALSTSWLETDRVLNLFSLYFAVLVLLLNVSRHTLCDRIVGEQHKESEHWQGHLKGEDDIHVPASDKPLLRRDLAASEAGGSTAPFRDHRLLLRLASWAVETSGSHGRSYISSRYRRERHDVAVHDPTRKPNSAVPRVDDHASSVRRTI